MLLIHSQVLSLVHLLLEWQLTLNSVLPLPLQAATFVAPASYVIEYYENSPICNILPIDSNGTLIYFYYPYGILLPCLKLSLIAELNLNYTKCNLEEMLKVRNIPQCH